MLDTTIILLKDQYRSFHAKLKGSPILYFFFGLMIIFSLAMFAVLTITIIENHFWLTVSDVFFFAFFVFLMKSAADTHRLFIIAPQVSYALSTPTSHRRILANFLLAILLVNLGIWFAFSGLYLWFMAVYHYPFWYPVEYATFSLGVVTAQLLGFTLAIHYFSPHQSRLIPSFVLLALYGFVRDPLVVVLTVPVVALLSVWALSHGASSYRYVKRKKRSADTSNARMRGILPSLFYREVTTLWRDRLFSSFVSMSIFTAFGTGFLYLHGTEFLLPPALQRMMGSFLPTLFIFLGVYVVVLYTAVFPALNIFLTEERTLWILQTMPVTADQVVLGKSSALVLCFLTALPYLAFIPIFIGLDRVLFLAWFLAFSYLTSVMVALPFGVKYVGKKSDILLLYSLSLILFVSLSLVATWVNLLSTGPVVVFVSILVFLLLLVAVGVFVSLKLSGRLLRSSTRLA